MRRTLLAVLAPVLLAAPTAASADDSAAAAPDRSATSGPDRPAAADSALRAALQASIDHHLGRPYVWGACGLKSYDCSGFVWRLMLENGILVKRTTARKYYMVLPEVSEADRWAFGNVVFFSNRKHCGIVNSRDTFYHAQTSKGTTLSRFDPLWRGRICGIRALPRAAPPDTSVAD